MFRFITPLILVIVAIGSFVLFTDPTYKSISSLKIQNESYNDALDNSKKLQAIRDELSDKYKTFPQENLDRLSHLLPNNVNNIRLIIEINDIASAYEMTIENVKFSTDDKKPGSSPNSTQMSDQTLNDQGKSYGIFDLEFSTKGNYNNFSNFLKD